MKRKKRKMRSKRRTLCMERLDSRRVLAALSFAAADGIVSQENGDTVVTIEGGATTSVTGIIESAESSVQGYQLNLGNSNSQLIVENYALGTDFTFGVDQNLDSSADDYFVASVTIGDLAVPPTRSLGSFDVTIPDAPGDYRLTADLTTGGELDNTLLSMVDGQTIPITEFGDIVFRVDAPVLPTVEISPESLTQNEDAGSFLVTVTLSETSEADVMVPLGVSGTALLNSDYTVDSSVIIPAGSLSATTTVEMIDDSEQEGDETIVLTLQDPEGADLGTSIVSTITIPANDEVLLGDDVVLDLVPNGGTVTTEDGVTVVTLSGGATVGVTGQVVSSEQSIQTFQLNLENSSSNLTLDNFALGSEFTVANDTSLDSSADDYFVSGAVSGDLAVPPVRSVGSFDVTVPNAPGDYRLTADAAVGSIGTRTAILTSDSTVLEITDFGDIIFRVDLPTVSIDPVSISRDESAGTATMTVQLSEPSTSEVVVPFVISGTATITDDFTISNSPIRIPAGQDTATIAISIVDDSDEETSESVIVTLINPSGAALDAASQSTLTILDNDSVVQQDAALSFVPGSGTVSQEDGTTVVTVSAGSIVNVAGQVGSDDAAVQGFQLNLSNSDSALGFGNFVTSSDFPIAADDTLDSSSGDFFVSSALIGELSLPPTRSLGTFDVIAPQAPGDYRFTADFTSGSETENTLLSNSSSTLLNITDFGDLVFRVEAVTVVPTVTLSPASANAGEEDGTAIVTATLSEASDSPVVVQYSVSGDATAGDDYSISSSPLTIPAGQLSATIEITLVDDSITESDETVTVSVTSVTNATVGANDSSTLTIIDNDIAVPDLPVVSVASPSQTVGEDVGAVTFDVSLSFASDVDVSVPFTLSGTASETSDYTITASPITIAAGTTSVSVTANIVDDVELEDTESIVVTLGEPTNADLGSDVSHTVNITDNDDDGDRPTRILTPEIVPRPYVIPGDLIPTAIMFAAVNDTTIYVIPVGSASLAETIIVVDEGMNQISVFEDGIVMADLAGGSLYAVIFEPLSEEGRYTLIAQDGEASLTRATSTNIFMPTDTNGDGLTSPRDALLVINTLQRSGAQNSAEGEEVPELTEFVDVNGDGQTSPIDALHVINALALQENTVVPISANAESVKQFSDDESDETLIEELVVSRKIIVPVSDFIDDTIVDDLNEDASGSQSVDTALAEVDDFLTGLPVA